MNHRRFSRVEEAVVVGVEVAAAVVTVAEVAVAAVVAATVAVAVAVAAVEVRTRLRRHVFVKPFVINTTESSIKTLHRTHPILELEMR